MELAGTTAAGMGVAPAQPPLHIEWHLARKVFVQLKEEGMVDKLPVWRGVRPKDLCLIVLVAWTVARRLAMNILLLPLLDGWCKPTSSILQPVCSA